MRLLPMVFLGALLILFVSACAVERTGLHVGEGGLPLVDGGPTDGGPELDAPTSDLGMADLGSDELGLTDLGGDDLGRGDLGNEDLGVTDLGVTDLGVTDLGVTDLGVTDLGAGACADLGFPRHRSCRELRDDPCLAPLVSGLYEIDVDGTGPRPAVPVYCDMSIDGGGWTLIGRSDNTEETFGWTTPFGAPDVDSAPYALGLGSALVFREVLIGRRGAGKDWGTNPVFHFTVPVGFVAAYAAAGYAIADVTVVQGSCAPTGGSPTMLGYTGHTSATDHFFFGDTATLAATGLRGVNVVMSNNSCDISGTMNGHGGMLMVR